MKFLITGAEGQLGFDVKRELISRGYDDILSPGLSELDITNEPQVKDFLLRYKPDIIFHCAAYTAVDKAEEEKDKCYNVNVNGTKYLTEMAEEIKAKIIYISTDYVFDGSKDGYYDVTDEAKPINYYGETKYLGEKEVSKYSNHIIVRISWVFGINGKNFIKTMLKLGKEKDKLSVVSDQIGSPTYTKDLARLLVDMAFSDKKGLYHATNEGVCSWYELTKYIFELTENKIEVNPILTSEYKTTAKRPLNSKLNKDKLEVDGFEKLPDWHEAVKNYIKELEEEEK